MKEKLQNFIYTEKLLALLYRKAAALAPTSTERNALLRFSQEATQNQAYLNYLYKQEFGTNYDPMIPEQVVQGNYRDILVEIVKQELESFLLYRGQTYFQDNKELGETLRYISDVKLGHILAVQSILIDMSNQNTPNE